MYLFVCDFFEIYPCGHIYQWLLLLFSQSCPTLCNPMDCSMVGFPDFHYLPEFAQTHVHWLVMPSNHLVFCRPLLLLPSTFPASGFFPQ